MPETTKIEVNLINPTIFYQSHSTSFVESTASQPYAIWLLGSGSEAGKVSSLPVYILISSLERGYKTLKPILAKVEPVADGYVASFDEANIHTSGETWASAALNLKSLILDVYDSLVSETASLSRPSKRQLTILLRYVQKDNS